jgi:hypothetical protein
MFSSRHPSLVKCVVSEKDTYLLDLPMYEKDKAYVPVTPKLLIAPVWEIMHGIVIKDKNLKVRTDNIMRWLQIFHYCWEHIGLQTVKQAMQLIVLD